MNNPVQTQRAGAIVGGLIRPEIPNQSTQPARPKEVPEKLDQLRNCVEQLEQTTARLIDGMETGGVMAPQHPEPAQSLVGGTAGQVTSMGGDLEQLRARVMQVVDRLQSAHSRLEV